MERTDWYTIKPRKNVDVKLDNNKAVEFRKDDMPEAVSKPLAPISIKKTAFAEDSIVKAMINQTTPSDDKPVSFAR